MGYFQCDLRHVYQHSLKFSMKITSSLHSTPFWNHWYLKWSSQLDLQHLWTEDSLLWFCHQHFWNKQWESGRWGLHVLAHNRSAIQSNMRQTIQTIKTNKQTNRQTNIFEINSERAEDEGCTCWHIIMDLPSSQIWGKLMRNLQEILSDISNRCNFYWYMSALLKVRIFYSIIVCDVD